MVEDYARLELKIDPATLRRMSMEDLANFASVMQTLSDIVGAFSCEPRFQQKRRSHGQNTAGGPLVGIQAFLQCYADAAIDVAKETKPVSRDEIRDRYWTLLEDEVRRRDVMENVVEMAAEAVADEARAPA